jgi:hypothetical protein
VILPVATFGTATASGHPTFCSGMAVSDSTVYDTTQVTERPVLYDAQPLRYPAKARAPFCRLLVIRRLGMELTLKG